MFLKAYTSYTPAGSSACFSSHIPTYCEKALTVEVLRSSLPAHWWHVQSLILACTLIIIGFLTFMIGLVADVIAANRKLLQDIQYHARRAEYDAAYRQIQIPPLSSFEFI